MEVWGNEPPQELKTHQGFLVKRSAICNHQEIQVWFSQVLEGPSTNQTARPRKWPGNNRLTTFPRLSDNGSRTTRGPKSCRTT
nr:unnamed protein product [Callosobruchus analis]